MKPSLPEQRYELVTEFHDAFKVHAARTWGDVSNATALARRALHDEEFKEYMDADEPVDILDALVDMEYIACGSQHLLAVKRPVFTTDHTLYYCHARVMDELNKSQLCQNGLTNSLGLLRSAIERVADNNDYRFHDAFLHVHEKNMKKRWKEDQLHLSPAGSTRELSSTGLYIVKRADGKILKPPGWTPPALKRYV